MQVIDFILTDSRVQIVISLVVLAIVVAGFLTFLEFRVKSKRNKKKFYAAKEYFIKKLQRGIREKKTVREKLDLLDRTAKDYFQKNFGSQSGDNYAALEELFVKKKLDKHAYFSRGMFEAYYSMSGVDDSIINSLTKVFTEIYREREFNNVSEISPFRAKIEKIIYKEEKKKHKNIFDYLSIVTSKMFTFLMSKISFIFNLLKRDKRSYERDWSNNFEDLDKERIMREFEDEGQLKMRHALVMREKEIAQRKLDELRKKKFLKEEEKKQIDDFEEFLKSKKEEHFVFYGQ
jgi:hypothetical protein